MNRIRNFEMKNKLIDLWNLTAICNFLIYCISLNCQIKSRNSNTLKYFSFHIKYLSKNKSLINILRRGAVGSVVVYEKTDQKRPGSSPVNGVFYSIFNSINSIIQ